MDLTKFEQDVYNAAKSLGNGENYLNVEALNEISKCLALALEYK